MDAGRDAGEPAGVLPRAASQRLHPESRGEEHRMLPSIRGHVLRIRAHCREPYDARELRKQQFVRKRTATITQTAQRARYLHL